MSLQHWDKRQLLVRVTWQSLSLLQVHPVEDSAFFFHLWGRPSAERSSLSSLATCCSNMHYSAEDQHVKKPSSRSLCCYFTTATWPTFGSGWPHLERFHFFLIINTTIFKHSTYKSQSCLFSICLFPRMSQTHSLFFTGKNLSVLPSPIQLLVVWWKHFHHNRCQQCPVIHFLHN